MYRAYPPSSGGVARFAGDPSGFSLISRPPPAFGVYAVVYRATCVFGTPNTMSVSFRGVLLDETRTRLVSRSYMNAHGDHRFTTPMISVGGCERAGR